jgi:hypothetical protein
MTSPARAPARPAGMPPRKVTREDLEAKFRELRSEVDITAQAARSYIVVAGGLAVVAIATVAFLLGRRRGHKQRTIVEVHRL